MSVIRPGESWISDYILIPDLAVWGNRKGQLVLNSHCIAESLVKPLQRIYRYNPDEKAWYGFDIVVWKKISTIYSVIRQALKEIRSEFKERMSKTDQAEYVNQNFTGVDNIHNHRFIYEVIQNLQADQHMQIHNNEFDTDPYLLNTPDGTYNLLTGERHPNTPDDFCRQITTVAPIEGECPNYTAHKEFMSDDRDGYNQYLDELSGYVSTGLTICKEFYWWYGFRDTGKSSLANIWLYCLGSYADVGTNEQFSEKYYGEHKQIDHGLRNKRLVFVDELKGSKLDGAKIKAFTGGTDVKTNAMRENSERWRPICKLLFTSNNYLSTDSEDSGTAGRLRLAEFRKEIPANRRIGSFEEKMLRPEAPQILYRMIQYAAKVIQQGRLTTPDDIIATTKEYLDDNDVVNKFLIDATSDNEFSHVLNKDLIAAAAVWSEESGLDLPGKTKLIKLIKHKNKKYVSYRSSTMRGISGIELKTEWAQKAKHSSNYAFN